MSHFTDGEMEARIGKVPAGEWWGQDPSCQWPGLKSWGLFRASRASPEKREDSSNLSPWIFMSPTLLLKSCAAVLPMCAQENSKQEGRLARASWWETPSIQQPSGEGVEWILLCFIRISWVSSFCPLLCQALCVWRGMKVCVSDRVCYKIPVGLRT